MTTSTIYRDGKVHVLAEQCSACLLSPGRIVSGARAAQIVRDTKDDPGATFICHKAQLAGEDAICRGWFDRLGDRDPILRLAATVGVLEFVALPAPLNPDCRDRKHAACRGDAWDFTTDQPAPCSCPCHEKAAAA